MNYEEALDLVYLKSQDYATEADPFKNFRQGAAFAGVTVEQGILVRIGDKFARVVNLIEKGQDAGAVGESITDTLRDAMNYTNILLTWQQLGRPEVGKTFAEQVPLPLVPTEDVDPELDAYVSEIEQKNKGVYPYGGIPVPETTTKSDNWFIDFIARKLEERNARK